MDKAEFDNIKSALRNIVEQYGGESLLNPAKAKALMSDFLPKNKREIKIIVSALEENIGKIIAESISDNKSDKKLIFQKCTNIIVKNLWLEENAAKTIVSIIEYALTGNNSEISQNNAQINNTPLNTSAKTTKSVTPPTIAVNTPTQPVKQQANSQTTATSNSNNKYTLTDETINVDGHTLYRIKALKDFGGVKAGDLGGYVEHDGNLSHRGDCWIYDTACVYDEAQIKGNAKVSNRAQVYGYAHVYGNALVYDDAKVYGNAKVYGDARVNGKAYVCDKYVTDDRYYYKDWQADEYDDEY